MASHRSSNRRYLDPRTRLRLAKSEPLMIDGLGLGEPSLELPGAKLLEERRTDEATSVTCRLAPMEL